jgi:hypothetical protein
MRNCSNASFRPLSGRTLRAEADIGSVWRLSTIPDTACNGLRRASLWFADS